MSPARTRLAPDSRRRSILDAAAVLYASRPYDQVSTTELARAADVTRGLVHHYFGSKRELFLEVMRESVMMPDAALPDLSTLPLPERVSRTIDWILDAATTYGQAWVAASGAANLHGDSDVQVIVDEADDRAARLVLDALALPDDAALRARLRPVAAYVKALCREWLVQETLDRATVHADVCSAVLTVTGTEAP
ncbi:TetR family transcriptional regulator [Aeromicrobium sp. 636]|uniref:TetR/AcrR family transcriptional regulator n=1 Tax=Aeromicrobium senzhongii TaxID=2663859 RepID=A0A8I0K295_9ACTN|nr:MULTISPECIES: TetR/AcrR family transcriptional regulator [Aeromicrobium]MBC9225984.1 TetR/AcrR family transcriptional regulator [Aeromicrobium senzhongii]MCQ3998091.1 TetR family transcriptional regulator [Aeromicrobium sp. 636]MTB88520.1 TetR family transcriptional regulator [Aeromicrobium senzhongii]QNL94164.1 TetR/AcrR family transcriptional regulator [Aeromicrobium senzhongii]